jgi:hypothetical protein
MLQLEIVELFLFRSEEIRAIAQAVGGPSQISLDPLGFEGYVLNLLSICKPGACGRLSIR